MAEGIPSMVLSVPVEGGGVAVPAWLDRSLQDHPPGEQGNAYDVFPVASSPPEPLSDHSPAGAFLQQCALRRLELERERMHSRISEALSFPRVDHLAPLDFRRRSGAVAMLRCAAEGLGVLASQLQVQKVMRVECPDSTKDTEASAQSLLLHGEQALLVARTQVYSTVERFERQLAELAELGQWVKDCNSLALPKLLAARYILLPSEHGMGGAVCMSAAHGDSLADLLAAVGAEAVDSEPRKQALGRLTAALVGCARALAELHALNPVSGKKVRKSYLKRYVAEAHDLLVGLRRHTADSDGVAAKALTLVLQGEALDLDQLEDRVSNTVDDMMASSGVSAVTHGALRAQDVFWCADSQQLTLASTPVTSGENPSVGGDGSEAIGTGAHDLAALVHDVRVQGRALQLSGAELDEAQRELVSGYEDALPDLLKSRGIAMPARDDLSGGVGGTNPSGRQVCKHAPHGPFSFFHVLATLRDLHDSAVTGAVVRAQVDDLFRALCLAEIGRQEDEDDAGGDLDVDEGGESTDEDEEEDEDDEEGDEDSDDNEDDGDGDGEHAQVNASGEEMKANGVSEQYVRKQRPPLKTFPPLQHGNCVMLALGTPFSHFGGLGPGAPGAANAAAAAAAATGTGEQRIRRRQRQRSFVAGASPILTGVMGGKWPDQVNPGLSLVGSSANARVLCPETLDVVRRCVQVVCRNSQDLTALIVSGGRRQGEKLSVARAMEEELRGFGVRATVGGAPSYVVLREDMSCADDTDDEDDARMDMAAAAAAAASIDGADSEQSTRRIALVEQAINCKSLLRRYGVRGGRVVCVVPERLLLPASTVLHEVFRGGEWDLELVLASPGPSGGAAAQGAGGAHNDFNNRAPPHLLLSAGARSPPVYAGLSTPADVRSVLQHRYKNAHLRPVQPYCECTYVDAARAGCMTQLKWLRPRAPGNERDSQGATALMIAARRGFSDVVEYLLKRGADAGLSDSLGATAVHFAAARRHLRCLQLLLASKGGAQALLVEGASAQGRWEGSLTPAGIACQRLRRQKSAPQETEIIWTVVSLLLQPGAGSSLEDVAKCTNSTLSLPRSVPAITKRVVLLRHGQSIWNAEGSKRVRGLVDTPLTKKGHKLALKLGSLLRRTQALEKLDVQLVVVSPLSRTLQTYMNAVRWYPASHPDCRVVVDPRVCEQLLSTGTMGRQPALLAADFLDATLDFGRLKQNWWFTSRRKLDSHKLHTNSRVFLKREPLSNLLARTKDFMQWLAAQPETNILIVGHGTLFRHLIHETTSQAFKTNLATWVLQLQC